MLKKSSLSVNGYSPSSSHACIPLLVSSSTWSTVSPGQLSSESKEGSLHMVTLSLQLTLGATSPAGKLTGVSLMALSPFYKSSLTMRRMPSFVRRNLQTTSSDAIKFVPITSRVQCPLKLTIWILRSSCSPAGHFSVVFCGSEKSNLGI